MTMNMPTLTALGAAGIAVCLSACVPIAQYLNDRRMKEFCDKYGTTAKTDYQDNKDAKQQDDILLIVSPNSGSGKARKLFPSILKALQEVPNRSVEIYVLSSATDATDLYRTKDLSLYQSIVLVSGDSMLYEIVQGPLQENKGKWPYPAPIMLLPVGSSNVIYSENFGYGTPLETAIAQGLHPSNIQWGSVIQLSSPKASTPTRYALHTCFDGILRHMVSALDKYRGNLYAAFGFPALLILMIYETLMCDKSETPVQFHCILSDSEAMGTNLGYGLSRYDDQMIVTLVDKWPGLRQWFQKQEDDASGETAKNFHNGTPKFSWVQVMEKTRQFTLERTGHAFHFICDGTTTLPFQALDRVDLEIIPRSLPYYTANQSNKSGQ